MWLLAFGGSRDFAVLGEERCELGEGQERFAMEALVIRDCGFFINNQGAKHDSERKDRRNNQSRR
jgi:hypothetical protein